MNTRNKSSSYSYHHFPLEIWANILARMPVKALLRFRCVSKTWLGLIQHPKFIHMHLSLSKFNVDQSHVLSLEKVDKGGFYYGVFNLRSSDTTLLFEKFTTLFKDPLYFNNFVVRDHVNGILLLSEFKQLVLWNPSVRKCTLLPKFADNHLQQYKEELNSIRCVLGYDSLSDDYKVIVTGYYDLYLRPPSDLMIYSLRTNTWKLCSNSLDNFAGLTSYRFKLLARAIFINGVTYWMISKETKSLCKNCSRIVCFDFSSETFNSLVLPDDGNDIENMRFHFVMGGSLVVLEISSAKSCIWVREKVDNTTAWSWNKRNMRESNVATYEFFKGWNYAIGVRGAYAFLEKSRKFVLMDSRRVSSFNIDSHQIVENHLNDDSIRFCGYMDIYKQNLVMLQGMKSDETLASGSLLD